MSRRACTFPAAGRAGERAAAADCPNELLQLAGSYKREQDRQARGLAGCMQGEPLLKSKTSFQLQPEEEEEEDEP